MSTWIDSILKEFAADVARIWIATDPDNVLLDERVLAVLREREFDLIPFEDSIAFRAEYEERYRAPWRRGEDGSARALIVQLRGTNDGGLPWDYLAHARRVRFSLADLFPKLSYSVVRQIDPEYRDAIFAAQCRYAAQALGDSATKDFVLTHVFRFSPHLIGRPEELWRELLRLHYRNTALPTVLSDHVAQVLSDNPLFAPLPLGQLFTSKTFLLRAIQDAWRRYLAACGIVVTSESTPDAAGHALCVDIPFEHPDIRVIIDSMFMEGMLHPVAVRDLPPQIPEWTRVGIVQDPRVIGGLVEDGIRGVMQSMPEVDAPYRDWMITAKKMGEVLARYHLLDAATAQTCECAIAELQAIADARLQQWLAKHYADLPSLPVSRGPVMVHHIPRFLAGRRAAGEERIALLVFDGMADRSVGSRREGAREADLSIEYDEGACFAWAPTLTSVSRQAIYSGLKPREYADSIESADSDSVRWSRFWVDQGLRASEIYYRRRLQRIDQLSELAEELASPALKVVGLVIDTVDEMVHGAVLGKRGIAAQVDGWIDSGFVDQLFLDLLKNGFHVYLTADHGNVDAVGRGRPQEGASAEICGERVRTYRSEALVAKSSGVQPRRDSDSILLGCPPTTWLSSRLADPRSFRKANAAWLTEASRSKNSWSRL